jgi:DNA-binding response OmpR family regulator
LPKILVVDDDEIHLGSVSEWLKGQHYLVDSATTGKFAMDFIRAFEYDLLILDWHLPDISGIELTRVFRRNGGQTPILMLTARQSPDEIEEALDAGADDYVSKPFELQVLGARIRAQLRRSASPVVPEVLNFRDVMLSTASRQVTRAGVPISLQPNEFALLQFFAQNQNQVFSADQLLRRVWDSDSEVSLDAIYSCIKRIRKKLDQPGEASLIQNLHGVGYRFDP